MNPSIYITGVIEAHYVGEPVARSSMRARANASRYRLELLRGEVRNTQVVPESAWIPPAGDGLRQEALQATVFGEVCGDAMLRNVHVRDVSLSYKTSHNGKTYGRLVGQLSAQLVEPPKPKKPEPPVPQPGSDKPSDAAIISPAQPRSAPAHTWQPPLLLLVLGIAAVLLLTCGAARAGLWLLFLLPTLLLRRLVVGGLRHGTPMAAAGLVLVLWQSGTLLALLMSWWERGCQSLMLGPMVALVVGVYFAGVLPRARTLVINALILGAVLLSMGPPIGRLCP